MKNEEKNDFLMDFAHKFLSTQVTRSRISISCSLPEKQKIRDIIKHFQNFPGKITI